jgi:inositol transport system ATP-binding protein
MGKVGVDQRAARMTEPLLRVSAISKRFPGVQALNSVSLEVLPGEVHGLLGENGAGKSTLLKILAGAQQPDSGTIEFAGARVELDHPIAAQALGIVTIYQEFNLIPHLSVAENIFIGREPLVAGFIDWRALRAQTLALGKRFGLDLQPNAMAKDLSVASQQMVEIARALSMESRLIIMDEPTSALTERETQRLFAIVRDLKSRGISIIFVTHRLPEVMQICDRVTVLRDGRNAGEGPVGAITTGAITIDDIIRMMVGRQASEIFKPLEPRPLGEVALGVRDLSWQRAATGQRAIHFAGVSFEVRRGEIVGLAGLVGSGRTELARCLFGAERATAGTIEVEGRPLAPSEPTDAIRRGIGLVPEDRKQQALFLQLAVRSNLSIAALVPLSRAGFVSDGGELALTERFRRMLNIRMAGPEQKVSNLSGGNQQKVVLARWLALQPRILIIDEPTRGIDIGAKAEVHHHLETMAKSGMAILAISSELQEVLAISDRILVMRAGRLMGSVTRAEASEEKLMQMMTVGSITAETAGAAA